MGGLSVAFPEFYNKLESACGPNLEVFDQNARFGGTLAERGSAGSKRSSKSLFPMHSEGLKEEPLVLYIVVYSVPVP